MSDPLEVFFYCFGNVVLYVRHCYEFGVLTCNVLGCTYYYLIILSYNSVRISLDFDLEFHYDLFGILLLFEWKFCRGLPVFVCNWLKFYYFVIIVNEIYGDSDVASGHFYYDDNT